MNRLGLFVSAVVLLASSAQAATIFTATLNGATEVPPTGSTATGNGTVTLTGDSLSVFETFSGLIGGPAAAAHIHCCASPGTNAQVAIPFPGFPVATSGTYSNTFDLTNAATYTASFLTSSGGTAAGAEASLISALNAGHAYLNIHDAQFPGGEIEGFATAATPEPGSMLLLGFGLAAIGFSRRRFRA
jgi:hypothetical protein